MTNDRSTIDGMTAVAYSPGYGGGWYTWNAELENAEALLFDPQIIEGIMAQDYEAVVGRAHELVPGVYTGATVDGLSIEYVPSGTMFDIFEHDGAERIEVVTPALRVMA